MNSNPEARNNVNNGRVPMTVSGGGPKKLVIKPFKVQPKVPENFGLETWEVLKAAVTAVYGKNASVISKEELYRAVENLCLHKFAPKIYELLVTELQLNIKKKVESLKGQTSDHRIFLSLVDEVWKDHCDQLSTIRNIFLYLDRSYALTNAQSGIKLIWDIGNDIFRRHLEVECVEVQQKILTGLLYSIEIFRQGESYDNEIIGRISRMLITLDIYIQKFEQPFLIDTRRYFNVEGNNLINTLDPVRFLLLVDKRLHEANDMIKKYLNISTKKALFDAIENNLLVPHVNTLLEKGFKQLMDENRKDDLKRMFMLYDRVNQLELLKKGWIDYIRNVGCDLMANAATSKTPFVEEVLDFQEKLDIILKQAFFNNDGFKIALQRSFEHFLNVKQVTNATTSVVQTQASSVVASELIAKFLDKKLRGEKGVSESDIEILLEKVMTLFRYLQEKDIFEAFYKKYLSRRLLLGKSSSADLERNMLAKLKTECGSNFTAKLEGMFQDIEMSRECQSAFHTYCSVNANPFVTKEGKLSHEMVGFLLNKSAKDIAMDVETSTSSNSSNLNSNSNGVVVGGGTLPMHMIMDVQVLTTGYWPATPSSESLILPQEMLVLRDKFTTFYTNKYQGRRLSFAHALERCIISCRFPRGKKDLEVSLYQAVVLMCFNKNDVLSYAAIRSKTGLEDEELKRTLQSLACGIVGTRVLTKEPKGKDIDTLHDMFNFNTEFTNKLFRIKINTIQLKDTPEEVQKTHEEVFRDREYQVDAVIVRTMKSRKRLSHALLMSELMTQLRFPAQISDLKKRIESLIERDYLERDREDSSYYNYLA